MIKKVLPRRLQTDLPPAGPHAIVAPVKLSWVDRSNDVEVQTLEGETILVLTRDEARSLAQMLLNVVGGR